MQGFFICLYFLRVLKNYLFVELVFCHSFVKFGRDLNYFFLGFLSNRCLKVYLRLSFTWTRRIHFLKKSEMPP